MKSNISHHYAILQEMFGEFIDELQNPSLLKPFDEVFELQLPLRNAKLKFHSKVYGRWGAGEGEAHNYMIHLMFLSLFFIVMPGI